jgi:DNA-binding Lrp family transcriptional regulator
VRGKILVSDREFIDAAAKGLKIEAEPFKPLAERLDMTVDEVIERIGRLMAEKKVRRFAASVRHQPMGYSYNSMVIARTDEESLERAGQAATGIEAVSHCYQRMHPDGYPWCVYIMVHGRERETVDDAVEKIRLIPGVNEIEVCRSLGELKKTSVSGVSTDLDKAGNR